MILASMTLEQRENEVREVNRLIRQVCGSGRIAGGYPRDAVLGRDATDIDLWIPIRHYPSAARRVQLVMALGEALGQRQFRKVGDQSGRTIHEALEVAQQDDERRTQPSNAPLQGNSYTTGGPTGYVEAWEAHPEFFNNRGNFNPLQVIFTSNSVAEDIHFQFHVGLTQWIVSSEGNIRHTMAAMMDARNETLTLNNPLTNTPAKFASYLRKIKQKYDYHVNLNLSLSEPRWGEYYQALVNAGVMNAPREMVQTQTQSFDRNSIRFNDGESTFGRILFQWDEAPVSPTTPEVHHDEELRTGLPGNDIVQRAIAALRRIREVDTRPTQEGF